MAKVNYLGSSFIILFVLLALTENSYAIPEFARKYETSCATCHAVYPKLNPFGEVFRINGYQFPEGEEEKVKAEPVKLGAEAYKRVWPDAIWPSDMPRYSPLSFRTRMGYIVDEDENNEVVSQFGPPALQMMAAGTFSQDVSFYVGAHLFEDNEPGSIDRAFLKLNDMFSSFLPDKFLYLQIGQFIPEIVTFATNHRGLTNTAFAYNTYSPLNGPSFEAGHAHGPAPFGIEQFQLGLEASGIVSSRFRYVVGLVNGNGVFEDNNSKRDLYGRLSYKVGGIAFDGSGLEASTSSSGETSLALGAFAYDGTGTSGDSDFSFYRAGIDFNFYLYQLNLFGGYIQGKDGTEKLEYNLVFAEADFEVYPWLTCVLRYEHANLEDDKTIKRLIPNISALYFANVKFIIESRLNPDDLKFDNLYVGMDFAF